MAELCGSQDQFSKLKAAIAYTLKKKIDQNTFRRDWTCMLAWDVGTESQDTHLGGIIQFLEWTSGSFPAANVHPKWISTHYCKGKLKLIQVRNIS